MNIPDIHASLGSFTNNVSPKTLRQHSLAAADLARYHDPLRHPTSQFNDEPEELHQQPMLSVPMRKP
jgi:hypothetical protein